jgi:hypothetical protein
MQPKTLRQAARRERKAAANPLEIKLRSTFKFAKQA